MTRRYVLVVFGCAIAVAVSLITYAVVTEDHSQHVMSGEAQTDFLSASRRQNTTPFQVRPPALTSAPPPESATDRQAQLAARANYLYATLSSAGAQGVCTPGVDTELEGLLKESEGYENLWTWTFERLLACRETHPRGDATAALLESALKRHSQNPRVLELLAKHNLQTGNVDEAIQPAEDAVKIRDSYDGWATLASARLTIADRALALGKDRARTQALYGSALDAASRAASLATPGMRPFQLLKMARATLGQGNEIEALNLAAQAEQAMRAASSDSQAHLSADLFMQLGTIYYGAGQRDIGIAYMNQAISIASSDQHSRLTEWKRRVTAQGS